MAFWDFLKQTGGEEGRGQQRVNEIRRRAREGGGRGLSVGVNPDIQERERIRIAGQNDAIARALPGTVPGAGGIADVWGSVRSGWSSVGKDAASLASRIWTGVTTPLPPAGQMGFIGERIDQTPFLEKEKPEVLAETKAPAGLPGASTPPLTSVGLMTPSGISTTITPTPKVDGTKPVTQPPFTFEPTGVPGAEDFSKAQEGVPEAKAFASGLFGETTEAQQNVIDIRAAQQTNVADLESSRQLEGVTGARVNLEDVNRRVAQFNSGLRSIEAEVRAEAAQTNATESEIQAEINNRVVRMRPQALQLQGEQEIALANYQIAQDAFKQRFDATRADAQEAVDRVTQKLDFSVQNLNTAYSLLTGMKNYEVMVDAQRNEQRDASRAVVNVLVSNPAALRNVSAQDLANLEANAQMVPGTLASIKDAWRTGTVLTDALKLDELDGSLAYAVWDPVSGSLKQGKIPNYAKIAPKTSASSLKEKASFENVSEEMKAAYSEASAFLASKSRSSPSERAEAVFFVINKLGSMASNNADKALVDSLRSAVVGGGLAQELTPEKIQATFEAALAGLE